MIALQLVVCRCVQGLEAETFFLAEFPEANIFAHSIFSMLSTFIDFMLIDLAVFSTRASVYVLVCVCSPMLDCLCPGSVGSSSLAPRPSVF